MFQKIRKEISIKSQKRYGNGGENKYFYLSKIAIFFKLMHFLLNYTRLMMPHEEEYQVLQEKKNRNSKYFLKSYMTSNCGVIVE